MSIEHVQMPIAVNAMGGDEVARIGYSSAAVEGAKQAAALGIQVVLVGDKQVLPDVSDAGVQVVHAPGYIAMDDKGFASRVRADKKGELSIVRAVHGNRDGEFSGVVCAGSTGGAMAAATLRLKRISGITSPAIPTQIPNVNALGQVSYKVLLDSGANPATSASQFVENAMLGDAYAALRLSTAYRKIGLLTNGTEEGKGSETDGEVYEFLQKYGEELGIEFVGNAEGTDLFTGTRANVLLANGLTGNVALKTAEGVSAMIKDVIFGSMQGASQEELDAFSVIAPRMITPLTDAISKNKVGGAPLLGVNGNVVIAHGSSTAEGVKNAIIQASQLAGLGLAHAIEVRVAVLRQNEAAYAAYKQL